MELEDNEKAQQQLIGARQIYSSLLTDFRDDPRYYRGLGTAQIDLGRFFMKQKQAEPAIELFRGAIEAFRELPVDDVLARDGLGWAHQYMSAALLASNDVEEARREHLASRDELGEREPGREHQHEQPACRGAAMAPGEGRDTADQEQPREDGGRVDQELLGAQQWRGEGWDEQAPGAIPQRGEPGE